MPLAVLTVLLLQTAAADSATLRHANGLIPQTVTAVRVPRAPVLDGKLDDPAWRLAAAPVTNFRQTDPDEGKPASESTAVLVVYDDHAIYVGARLFDSEPRRIAKRLVRRDADSQSDEFRVLFDSYHDHRTAYRFVVNPAGVKSDLFWGDDGGFSDDSWDPVWEAAVVVDSLGWTAEIRIPFSQLRFSHAPEQVWGVRFVRWIQRKQEFDMFPFVGKTQTGLASRFAHLLGLRDIPAPRRFELLPYSVGRGTYHEPVAAANPFDERSRYFGGAGLDVKYGITSNLTVDAAFNPDFGQVEIDPAFVNLTAFEQFLPERRPFFIEGRDIFTFGGNGGGLNNFGGTPQFFYSRRIRRPPQGAPTSAGQFADVPDNTTILGAAKLSGKTTSLSLGVLEALTARERAAVVDTTTGARYSDEVQPLTNYFVGRLRRDFPGGDTHLGFLATAVNRQLDAPALLFLRQAAYAAGMDLLHRFGKSTYTLAASLGASYIRGDTAAIQAAQLFSNRYFQRPDAHSFHYDPSRTSLAGLTGDLYVNKVAGNWLWGLAGSTTTPGFEVNDIGFQRRVDRISGAAYAGYHWTKPGRVFRESSAFLSMGPSWNYDLDNIQKAFTAFAFGTFRNFWGYNASVAYSARALDDRLTRGGPLAATPAAWNAFTEVFSDLRRPVSFDASVSYSWNDADGWTLDLTPSVQGRPTGAGTYTFNVFGQDNGSTIAYDGAANAYTADPDGAGPAAAFSFDNPDFRTRSLRSNAVLRWEYRPGSTLFVVWTQSRHGDFGDPSFDLTRDLGRELLRDRPTNVLLVKLNYWLSR